MKFTIFKRLTFGYMAIMVLVIYLGVYVTLKLNQLNHLVYDIDSVDGVTIRLMEHSVDAIYSQVSFEKKYLISKDKDFFLQFWEIQDYILKDLEIQTRLMNTPEKQRLFSDVKGLYSRYLSLFSEEVGFVEKGEDYPRERLHAQKENIIEKINQDLRTIIKMARSDRDKKIHESSKISSHVLNVAGITAGLAIITGLLISFLNTRTINRSILLLQDKTKEIAKGKFEEIPNITSPPEIRALAEDFNIMCERLKELDEMKVDFISYVSHELRTPLTAIKEASSMLLEGVFVRIPGKQQELYKIIKEECERLINSVNRILDLSSMEAKMMDYQFREYDLAIVIQKSVLKLAPIAIRKKINLELKPFSDSLLIKMDEERIGQVVENLLGNALKFTPERGTVTINAAHKNNKGKSFIEVFVADTGCGIPTEKLEKIFDKFERIDNGRETARGTGLGLSIAKFIIAAHGGKIWAKSREGKGSTFFFTLPVS